MCQTLEEIKDPAMTVVDELSLGADTGMGGDRSSKVNPDPGDVLQL